MAAAGAKQAGVDKLFLMAGLGNPGSDYARTRHNAGFMVVEELRRRQGGGWRKDERFRSLILRAEVAGEKVLLCQPQTFMNASGESLAALAGFYKVPPSRMLVVVDDADLPLGQIRLRGSGSSGGHHGLESIEKHLGTREYARLRVGIGRTASEVREIANHVLGRFGSGEIPLLELVLKRAADQAECWLAAGLQKAMNQFNGVIVTPQT